MERKVSCRLRTRLGSSRTSELVCDYFFVFFFVSAYCLTSGFMCPGDLMPTPLLYFNGVGYVLLPLFFLLELTVQKRDGSCAVARFIPKIRAYITSDYEQTAILHRAIDGHCIWEQDLSCLDSEDTTWKLTYDGYHGYRITRG
jgi:hypothetical protein